MPSFRGRPLPPMPMPYVVPPEPMEVSMAGMGAPPSGELPLDEFSDPSIGRPHNLGIEMRTDPLTGETFYQRIQKYAPPSAYVGSYRGRG